MEGLLSTGPTPSSFHYFSPRIPGYLRILDIRLQKVGAKRGLNGTSKVNTHTDTQTHRHTDIWPFRLIESIRETLNLLTDADSSTDTTVGWTKNTQKPNFFEKQKKSSKSQKLKKSRDMPILAIYPSTRGL